MFIIDAPFASPLLLAWLEENQHPVLSNDFAQQKVAEGVPLNLVDDATAAQLVNEGQRVCTNSENALEWLAANTSNPVLTRGIELCKDKELMRKTLASLDPDLFFQGYDYDELKQADYAQLPDRLIVKPTVGFCSLGVYAVQSQQDWDDALAAIEADMERWNRLYPASVVGTNRFIVEQMVEGTEYALDMFYDEAGTPQLFNVFQHDFAGPEDTSDRLYWCSSTLQSQVEEILIPWLTQANELMGLRNFCIHIELRIQDGAVHLIELNPLRFAGLGGTDLSLYACGMLGYDVYLNGLQKPAFKTDDYYVMSVLMPSEDTPQDAQFDYDAFMKQFTNVLEMRRFERAKMSAFGFMFLQAPATPEGKAQLDYLLTADLDPFIL